ncbi:hypothetical protein MMC31_003154 [Peltigera leucophlebia]|nr:hypothetical protein [Peltigera leucophlebia]
MHRCSILLVVAAIAAAGEALSVVGNPWDTTSDLLTSSSSNPALEVQDVTDADVNSPQDIMAADVLCSPLSTDQARKKQPNKLRRRQACSLDRSRYKTSPPNAQEQGQQPHQISIPDDAENNPNDAANLGYSDFLDRSLLCNPVLVGFNRKFPVCDSGRVRDRSIFRGSVDHVNNVMTDGAYVVFDVTPGI